MDIANVVAKMRFRYHSEMTSVVNALNQLGLMSDEKADAVNEKHAMTIFNDILPRLGYDISSLLNEEKEEKGG